MHRVTARCCFLLVVAFCALSVSSAVAADDIAALRAKAEKGDAEAQTILGEKYFFGIGVPKDLREAAKWFWIAADQGHAKAQFNLGVSYRLGEGVPKDSVTAYAWYNLAAAQGKEVATKNRAIVARQMTPNQIAEAQRLSRQLVARIANRKRQPRAPGNARPAPAAKLAVTGTGFFVTDDGYFVTNAHVVEDASRVQVMTKKGTLPARVVHRDTINDLALLKVKGSFKALPVISSRRLREGSKVFTFGHPNPSIQGGPFTVPEGSNSIAVSASSHPNTPLLYNWDLDGDGKVAGGAGADPPGAGGAESGK